MAKSSRETIVVTKPVEAEVVNLTLSIEEATALRAVLNFVGGTPTGPRGLLTEGNDSVARVLTSAVPNWHKTKFRISGSVFIDPQ